MTKVSFFVNSTSSHSISAVKAQLPLFNPKHCHVSITPELLTTQSLIEFQNEFPPSESTITCIHEVESLDIHCFVVSTVSDLVFLRTMMPRVKLKLIIMVSYDIFDNDLFWLSLKRLPATNAEIVVCIRYIDDLFVFPINQFNSMSKIRLRNLSPIDNPCAFFSHDCWMPVFAMSVPENSRLESLHTNFIYRFLDEDFPYARIYSNLYIQKLKTLLPKSNVINKLNSLIHDDILKRSYLDYILNSRAGYNDHYRLIGENINELTEKNLVTIHSLLDPVNSMGLSSIGIGFCRTNTLSKALFNTFEEIRLKSIPKNRELPQKKRHKTILFVLARFFPDDVSAKSNSHYNILKLFCALIHHFNKTNDESPYKVKILITNEKSFKTPFGAKNVSTDYIFQANRNKFFNDGFIRGHSSLIVSEGTTKSESINRSLSIVDEIMPISCVFLGGTYDSKIARTEIYRKHPVTFLPTTSTIDNAFGRVDQHIDVIRAVSEFHGELIKSQGIAKEKVIHFAKPMFEELELKLTHWDWADYGSAKEAFFVATPLVGGRILNWLNSLNVDELDNFISMFDRCPSLVWVPIGAKTENVIKALKNLKGLEALWNTGKIIPIEYTEHLGSLIEHCQALFIPTLGGATTVAAATSLNVVSIVDERSDSNTIVSKIGQFNCFSDAFEKISKLYDSPSYRISLIDESRENLRKRFDIDGISEDFIKLLLLSNATSLGKKMKKILILGAGIYQVPLIQTAKKRGLQVHVVSPKGNYPGFELCDKAVYLDTRDYKAILDYCLKNEISGLVTTGTDVAVQSIGYAVEHGGYKGPSLDCANSTTNKVEMKTRLAEHQVPTARFKIIEDPEQLSEIIDNFDLPFMVKAVDTSGSRGIVKVDDINQLKDAYLCAKSNSKDKRIIVEEFLDGTELGAQVVVANNEILDIIIHGDIVTAPPIAVPIGHYLPYEINEELENKIILLSKTTVDALGINDAVCNFDLMVVNNEPYIIEVGSRMGATCLPENIGYYNGFDYYDLLIDISLGESIDYSTQETKLASSSQLLTSEKSGIFVDFQLKNLSEEGYKIDTVIDVQKGDQIHKFVNGTHRYGHVVVSGPTLSKCHTLLDQIICESKLVLAE